MILCNQDMLSLSHTDTDTHTHVQVAGPLMSTTTESPPNGLIFHESLQELIRVRGRFVLPIFPFQVWQAWN